MWIQLSFVKDLLILLSDGCINDGDLFIENGTMLSGKSCTDRFGVRKPKQGNPDCIVHYNNFVSESPFYITNVKNQRKRRIERFGK